MKVALMVYMVLLSKEEIYIFLFVYIDWENIFLIFISDLEWRISLFNHDTFVKSHLEM